MILLNRSVVVPPPSLNRRIFDVRIMQIDVKKPHEWKLSHGV